MGKKNSGSLRLFIVILFSMACGFFLVQLLIPLYFNILPPIPKSLMGFYVLALIKLLAIGILTYFLFKRGRKLVAVSLLGTTFIVFLFGVPIFIAENHHHLWHEAWDRNVAPHYYIEFGETTTQSIKFIYELYADIWRRVYIPVHLSIGVFFGLAIYSLMKRRKGK